jgi:hypothetical protein
MVKDKRALNSTLNNYGMLLLHPLLIKPYSSLFHPDNIKNYHPEGHGKVSHSLYEYWNTFGGPNGLADGLRTDLKVPYFKFNYSLSVELKALTKIYKIEAKSNIINIYVHISNISIDSEKTERDYLKLGHCLNSF